MLILALIFIIEIEENLFFEEDQFYKQKGVGPYEKIS
jgi:hypothetical protein